MCTLVIPPGYLANMERVFEDADGAFDFVINLAAETKYGQSDEVRVLFLSFFIFYFVDVLVEGICLLVCLL